jgi:ornithine cyclodeaminase/alanine dehydrogenase-like protein (mu-crystallin family)
MMGTMGDVANGPALLVLSRVEVESLLDLDALVDAVAEAMRDLSEGRASMPARGAALVPGREGLLAAMPAYLPSGGALTAKLVSLFPRNRGVPTHQALICCFDPDDGGPLAVMDGSYITAMRTAAGSALATRLLARPDARVVAIVGTGVQAWSHAVLLARQEGAGGRRPDAIRIAGRDPARVRALVDVLAGSGIAAQAAPSIEDAVRSADVVCAATHAEHPVIRREWLRAGTHVNSVGYNTAGEGEIDAATVRDALVVVESRDGALAAPPAGAVELRRAVERGVVPREHIRVEIGELVAGRAAGRTDEAQLTLYKSVGVAVQDAAAAALVLAQARRRGAGTRVAI